MVQNLEIEMAKQRITKKEVSNILGISPRALYGKLNGDTKFTTAEAFKIRDTFFPDLTLEYLFAQK